MAKPTQGKTAHSHWTLQPLLPSTTVHFVSSLHALVTHSKTHLQYGRRSQLLLTCPIATIQSRHGFEQRYRFLPRFLSSGSAKTTIKGCDVVTTIRIQLVYDHLYLHPR
jgi:hypothetical protein